MISRAIDTIIAALAALLAFSRRTVSTRHRILHWELPRLLSAIERLDIALQRDLASDSVRAGRGDGKSVGGESRENESVDRLRRERTQAIRSDLSLVVTQAERIKSILGYDIR